VQIENAYYAAKGARGRLHALRLTLHLSISCNLAQDCWNQTTPARRCLASCLSSRWRRSRASGAWSVAPGGHFLLTAGAHRGFKALKQMVKLHFKLNHQRDMMECYRRLLGYVKSAVTRNYSEKVINSILDHVSTSESPELLADFYETTLHALARLDICARDLPHLLTGLLLRAGGGSQRAPAVQNKPKA